MPPSGPHFHPDKANASAIRESLAARGRTELFHWTPLSNLPSIMRLGILCRRELNDLSITFTEHGYGAAGKEEDFANHTVVSFYPQKGMMHTMTEPQALIQLALNPAWQRGTFYVPGNTARNEYSFDEVATWTKLEHLNALFDAPGSWRLLDWQAEVWVEHCVGRQYITKVWFVDDATLRLGFAACKDIDMPGEVTFALGTWHFPRPRSGDATE